jgi:hypothetical protein
MMSFNTVATGTWLKEQLHVILNKTTYAPQIKTGIRKHSSQAFLEFFIQPPKGASANVDKSVPVPLSRATDRFGSYQNVKRGFFDFFF